MHQGSGQNSLILGSASDSLNSWIHGHGLTITAGASGQAGSITLQGGVEITNFAGGDQSVSTTGVLSITAGTSGSAHIVNQFGNQNVSAGSIRITGGTASGNNTAAEIANWGPSGGSQTINAGAGGIQINSGPGAGGNNQAQISQSQPASQTVVSGGDVVINNDDGNSYVNLNSSGSQSLSVTGKGSPL